MRTYTGSVWAEEQLYICDSGDPYSRSDSIDFAEDQSGVYPGFGIILFATPEHYGTIQVTVAVHDTDPGSCNENWTRVVEGTFATDAGELRVLGAEMNEATDELDQPLTPPGACTVHLRLHIKSSPIPEDHTWDQVGAQCLIQIWTTAHSAGMHPSLI